MKGMLDRLRTVILNRASMAARWHRLHGEELIRFVADDPDARRLYESDREIQDSIFQEYCRLLMEADEAERQRMRGGARNPEAFDEIVAILDRVKARWQSESPSR